jgi:hypothetical protein
MADWLPPGSGRELQWWDEAGLQTLARALRQGARDWLAAWTGDAREMEVGCRPFVPTDLQLLPTHACVAGGMAQAWLYLSGQESAALAQLLFPGAARVGRMGRTVMDACLADGLQRLAQLLNLGVVQACEGRPPATLAAAFSGAAWAEWGEPLHWRLAIGANAAAPWRRRSESALDEARPPLVSVTEALARVELPLQVELQGCELELGALRDLQVGDVVRLPQRLDSLAAVRQDGSTLFSAHLGREGGAKAVELAPA